MITSGHVSETAKLERRVRALEIALETALIWMCQSANTPLRQDDVQRILKTMRETGYGK